MWSSDLHRGEIFLFMEVLFASGNFETIDHPTQTNKYPDKGDAEKH